MLEAINWYLKNIKIFRIPIRIKSAFVNEKTWLKSTRKKYLFLKKYKEIKKIYKEISILTEIKLDYTKLQSNNFEKQNIFNEKTVGKLEGKEGP